MLIVVNFCKKIFWRFNMYKFKVGDIVEIVDQTNEWGGVSRGDIGTVTKVNGSWCHVDTETQKDWIGRFKCFRLAHRYPNPPHIHAELIKAWADGAEIEHLSLGSVWRTVDNPKWCWLAGYRIKPNKTQKQLEIERIEAEMRKLADDLAKVKGDV